jgi:YVTN family beta-propeller protein
MRFVHVFLLIALIPCLASAETQWPGPVENGYLLPNGWRITPIGTALPTHDLILNLQPSPDGKVMVALTCGFNPHELVVIDTQTDTAIQHIPMKTAWFGLAWEPGGKRLFVSGGNDKKKDSPSAPVYIYGYENGKLSEQPVGTLSEDLPKEKVFWAGLAIHPTQPLLYAANRAANEIVVFDTATGQKKGKVATEQQPNDAVLSPDGKMLYVSNWGSDTVSFIDTGTLQVTRSVKVGDNPNDMLLAPDGRLYVCCSNDNSVVVIDTAKCRPTETILTSLHERAPEGSTPNALAMDPAAPNTLYVANADNYNVCVIQVEEPGESAVLGFIPTGWYPSALAVGSGGKKLFIGNGKGVASYSNVDGPHSPKAEESGKTTSTKSGQTGAVTIVDINECRPRLRQLTQQVYANCPYNDDLLSLAPPVPEGGSVVPREVGTGSPIKHVIYIIKENRTYDQVLGDLPQGNGDPSLTLFGRDISPNIHSIVEQYVLLDNLYCDAEVSVDGHQWSNAAYATDYTEKNWPAEYGGWSDSPSSRAVYPSSGYIWDQCASKGLTYRTYGEFADRQSETGLMVPTHPGLSALHGHVAPNYLSWGARDPENAKEFIREFEEYEKNYDNPDPEKRLPNFIVMALPEDHTHGSRPGEHTPRACVASNDYALGMIIERLTQSRYWPQMAVFAIQDDAQDGPDHVDARRTEAMVISPYSRLAIVDSTLYTTSSMLRTIELLLGLQPMSQYDAAANPMYRSLAATPNTAPYTHIEPRIDLKETNAKTAWGAEESMKMDLSTYDKAPMFELNEIIWKSVKGAESEMPLPVHRFQTAGLLGPKG